ncbi:MAG: hypothetical protein MI976_01585 [Pseudomonadales bacterium]|nr:hypothetical protein [Pseudomonadales bacterium]
MSTLALSLGCGGGGGSSSGGGGGNANGGGGSNGGSQQTGLFIDGPVAGVRYQTTDANGNPVDAVTNAAGEYAYVAGRSINFSLGKVSFGTIVAQDITTPFSFVDSESNPEFPLNLARLLQTFDEDGDPENGLDIPEAVSAGLLSYPGNIADLLNSTQGNFESSLQNILDSTFPASGYSIVERSDALSHLSDSLATIDYSVNLAGTSWHTEYQPLVMHYWGEIDQGVEGWVHRQSCNLSDFDLYRVDSYTADRVNSHHWQSFQWVPQCARVGGEVTEPSRLYDLDTLCGAKMIANSSANLTTCSLADLNNTVTYSDVDMNITLYSAHTPNTNVVYRTLYKEYYDEEDNLLRETWQLVTTRISTEE